MFNNIGRKIKNAVKYVCYMEIACCIVAGIAMMFMENFLQGISIALLGSAAAWLASVTMYGFGQLIENTDKLVAQGGGSATASWDKATETAQNTENSTNTSQKKNEVQRLYEQGKISKEAYHRWVKQLK